MHRSMAAVVALLALALAPQRAPGADDAAAGYAKIRPALVKVWAFDAGGRPIDSGSGVVIASDGGRSYVLTAAHVVAKAAAVRIDVNRDRHDIPAHVLATNARDLALLRLERSLPSATLAPRSRAIVEGNVVAVAGYVKHDELIGVVGQEPRLLYPGTISSRPDDGAYLELENVHVEEGLSGGPVFDPHSGEVLGIVTTRTTDQRGGFAVSVPLVALAFVQSNGVAKPAPPAPKPLAVVVAAPVPKPLPMSVAAPPKAALPGGPSYWEATDVAPQQFAFSRDGCAVVVTVKVTALAVALSSDGLLPSLRHHPQLEVSMARSVAPSFACAGIPSTPAFAAAYEPNASSFDGHHLTVRYAFEGVDTSSHGNDVAFPDQSLFPSDVSLDADVVGGRVLATIQFLADDWNGMVQVTLQRADVASTAGAW